MFDADLIGVKEAVEDTIQVFKLTLVVMALIRVAQAIMHFLCKMFFLTQFLENIWGFSQKMDTAAAVSDAFVVPDNKRPPETVKKKTGSSRYFLLSSCE